MQKENAKTLKSIQEENSTFIMAASTTEANSSVSNVTAGVEEENSLNTEQIVLICLAGFFLLALLWFKQIYRLCVDYPRKALDLFLFILFNIMLNGGDVVLDILTAEDLGNPTPVSYQGLTISYKYSIQLCDLLSVEC